MRYINLRFTYLLTYLLIRWLNGEGKNAWSRLLWNNGLLLGVWCRFSSSSSEQELQFSDDDDGSEEMPDVSWQEFVRRAYIQRFGVQTASTGNSDKKSSDTDTVGGASDADWETESDTEQEAGMWLGGVVVRASDLGSRDRKFDSRPVHCRIAQVSSAFPPTGVGKSSTSLMAGVKAGHVHLCPVAGNTV